MNEETLENEIAEVEIINEPTKVCECGKCEECRQFEISHIEGKCNCEYKTIEHENGYQENILVAKCDYCKQLDLINTKYDNYKLLKQANINQELWDSCSVINGVIYTPNTKEGGADMQTLFSNLIISTL